MFGYYTGANQGGASSFDTSEYYTQNATTSVSRSLTSTTDNSWHVGFNWSDASNPSAGSGTIIRYVYGFMDSNGAITPAGSHSLNYTFGGNNNIGLAHAILKPPTSTAYTITAAQGSYTFTGQAATITSARKIAAAFGSFVLTGIDAAFSLGHGIVAAVGLFTLTGQAAIITSARKITAAVGSFTLTGIAASFIRGVRLVAAVGTFGVTMQSIMIRIFGWFAQAKSADPSWSAQSKSSAPTWTAQDKSTT